MMIRHDSEAFRRHGRRARLGTGAGEQGELGLGPADRFPLLTFRLREPGLMQKTGIGPKPSKLY